MGLSQPPAPRGDNRADRPSRRKLSLTARYARATQSSYINILLHSSLQIERDQQVLTHLLDEDPYAKPWPEDELLTAMSRNMSFRHNRVVTGFYKTARDVLERFPFLANSRPVRML